MANVDETDVSQNLFSSMENNIHSIEDILSQAELPNLRHSNWCEYYRDKT